MAALLQGEPVHGRPPEGDCKPPQAADFAPYRAATHFGFLAGLEHLDYLAGQFDGVEVRCSLLRPV
jgi:hypothetical protein